MYNHLKYYPVNKLVTSTNAIQIVVTEDKLCKTSKLLITNLRNTFKNNSVTCIILVRQNITNSRYVSAAKWVISALTWMASGWRSDSGTLLDTTEIGVGIGGGSFSPRMYASKLRTMSGTASSNGMFLCSAGGKPLLHYTTLISNSLKLSYSTPCNTSSIIATG